MLMPDEKDIIREEWKRRLHTVGRAQTRYLYVLLIVGLFYLALHLQITDKTSATNTDQQLPLIGIIVNRLVIWASAPIVLGFILLAALGTFSAIQVAKDQLKIAPKDHLSFERIDIYPTAIDFIVYNKYIGRLGAITYPVFLLLFYLEAWWIWLHLIRSDQTLPFWTVFVVIGIIVLLLCFPPIGRIWYLKIKSKIHPE